MSSCNEKFSPHSHTPYGDDGSGFYSDNTIGCYNVILESAPLMLESVKSALVRPGSVFTIVDYGCADGGTSMPLLYACVKELRKIYGDDLPIHVIYEDQPVNDFKSLFLRLQGLIPGPKSYFLDFPNVFVTTCGTSFYSQCLPPQSVNLGFSATAMHWLRDKPCSVTGALHHTMITIPEEAEKFQNQAAKDWETILLARAKEMAPGKQLFVSSSMTSYKEHNPCIETRKIILFPNLIKVILTFLCLQDEFNKTTFFNYYRTVTEFKKPFESADSPVRKAGLSLVSIETKVVPCPYREKWLKNGGDPEVHARWFIPTTRTWSNATFLSGLSEHRSPDEKADIVDEFFKRYENQVVKHPEDHGMDYVHAFLVIAKS
ncbi:probable S-adenosylmethionine-dependent methyltransferase At5g37970 [Orbicella faveolata]|uniref:probable S-adenosylmethionine-dependent methyltransferase At5g37970 n=1 Tax=Orbicella faveolata TaxID=48498 RepID=UPI0009E2C3A6|nr:probable S-adenosylmethionine-dependent methyltransferase At5g37970 [Orbicella faveolata]